MKTISILGCGWLGLPLGKHLGEKGYRIKGSTTSQDKINTLRERAIEPFIFSVTDEGIEGKTGNFFDTDILFVNIPPRRKIEGIATIYPAQITNILKEVGPDTKVIFISSTSVYPNINGEVTENMELKPEKESGKALAAAEERLHVSFPDATIIRFAGLIGPDRNPGRFLAGKKGLDNGGAPVNLIHLDDCIGIVDQIIEKEQWGYIFNACADEHPTKKDYYTQAALAMGLDPPEFIDTEAHDFKLISNDKLKRVLGYTFKEKIT